MGKPLKIEWLNEPEKHNYPAAASFLSLLYPPHRVKSIVAALKRAPLNAFAAKDLFRASGLSLLGVSNSHVARDQKKIRRREPLSPLLLARDERGSRLIVADGYHRLCAVYSFDEDAIIACKIV
jgi:disulfide oxidoreductase YuzD